MGGSAGGLLMGAVANMSPADYRGIVAQVPFVDVVTTMLDDSIPLTTNEYDEWGNPNERASTTTTCCRTRPTTTSAAQAYPAMFVTTGLWDSQVQYYEPAKWVAKLRALKTDQAIALLLHIEMEAGHGGKSGRFQRYREIAMEYAFILDQAGIRRVKKGAASGGSLTRGAKIDQGREQKTRALKRRHLHHFVSHNPWRRRVYDRRTLAKPVAATRAAEATRASIPSSANWPSPRRTNKVASAASVGHQQGDDLRLHLKSVPWRRAHLGNKASRVPGDKCNQIQIVMRCTRALALTRIVTGDAPRPRTPLSGCRPPNGCMHHTGLRLWPSATLQIARACFSVEPDRLQAIERSRRRSSSATPSAIVLPRALGYSFSR